ncbi:hypothetical protein [Luteimonas sp. MC1825]|uniref:hypothetical protein n=1 Tax=Luteimonas sp. MC1825 TaxID=2761107 RepID=UPI001614DB2E|nr:hypothetical protein [Luteimonas sp. MC1825]MBB6600380.1 hypothetical protein [Luteimonas sp. MC1825]QOC88054.1 hypothetical protein IDM46_12690 [Luteimonas sp. MC1825]
MIKQWMALGVWLALLVLASNAPAQTRAAMLKQAEASMLLTGRIDVAVDGTVTAYSIDRQDEVPEAVRTHVARNVPRWQVQPATSDGVPIASSTRFSMRLVTRRHDGGNYKINIVGVHIDDELPSGERLTAPNMAPPVYPRQILELGGTGVVYVLAKVGLDGRVVDTHVERFNLTVLARGPLAGRIRDALSKAALTAVSGWSFRLPEGASEAGRDYVVIRMPIEFTTGGEHGYGAWKAYIPGEHSRPAWAYGDDGNDALAPQRATLAGSGLRLASALEPEGS